MYNWRSVAGHPVGFSRFTQKLHNHWIGLRENLQEPWFLPSNIGLSCKFSHHPILWQSALICFDQLFEMIRWSLRTSQVDFILPGRLTQLTPQNLHAQLFYFARMGMDQRRLHHDPGTLFIPNPSDFLCLPGYQTWFWHSLPYQKPPPRCICEWCSH